MRNLVRRYVTVEQRKAENQGVTEDDVNEIKQVYSGAKNGRKPRGNGGRCQRDQTGKQVYRVT